MCNERDDEWFAYTHRSPLPLFVHRLILLSIWFMPTNVREKWTSERRCCRRLWRSSSCLPPFSDHTDDKSNAFYGSIFFLNYTADVVRFTDPYENTWCTIYTFEMDDDPLTGHQSIRLIKYILSLVVRFDSPVPSTTLDDWNVRGFFFVNDYYRYDGRAFSAAAQLANEDDRENRAGVYAFLRFGIDNVPTAGWFN